MSRKALNPSLPSQAGCPVSAEAFPANCTDSLAPHRRLECVYGSDKSSATHLHSLDQRYKLPLIPFLKKYCTSILSST